MSSIPEADDRFDEAEAELDWGEPWLFRQPGMPNPLTITGIEWSEKMTPFGRCEFMTGFDRNGKKWSVLVGGAVLSKRLIDGLVEEWDDEQKTYVVVETLGRVARTEVVSIRYVGDREGASGPYPDVRVVRKRERIIDIQRRNARRAAETTSPTSTSTGDPGVEVDTGADHADDDIDFGGGGAA